VVVLDVDHADRLVTLGPDDVLIVTKLDRLARSSRDLLNIVSQITEVGASFKSLRDQWADTTTPTGRMILTVLSGIAEFERELINERTGEGRTRALENGVQFGRPSKLSTFQRREALQRKEAGEPVRMIAQSYGVHHSQISRLK